MFRIAIVEDQIEDFHVLEEFIQTYATENNLCNNAAEYETII